MEFKKIHEDAKIPTRATEGSVGYDVCCVDDVQLLPWRTTLVKTGLVLNKLPPNTYLRVAPRSGLALNKSLIVNAGVVDPDYRGEIGVVILASNTEHFLRKGDKIAQFIVESCMTPDVTEVQGVSDTQRGTGGYGSTGA